MRSACAFKNLPTLKSPFFFSQDELHLICHGVGKTVFDFLTVDLNKTYNKCIKLVIDKADYPFFIDRATLNEIGQMVADSKPYVSVKFSSKWVNPIKYTGGNRAVDNLNFLLYVVPACFIPYLTNAAARSALSKLIKGCALSLQWEISKDDVQLIRR